MKIQFIIRDLLLRNDQLLIPGLGTFRVIHQPAQISKSTGFLSPPSKNIVFDSLQKSGDNLLLLAVRKKMGLSEEEASETLKTFIKDLENDITAHGTATLEGLGKIGKDNSKKLIFTPEEMLNLSGVFALPKIEIPVHATDDAVRRQAMHTGKRINRNRKKWLIPVAVVGTLIILASLVYYAGMFRNYPGIRRTPVNNEAKNPNRIVFGNRETQNKDTLKESVSRQLEEKTNAENALRIDESIKKSAPPVQSTPPAPESRVAGPYYIISGAFGVLRNAERQQAVLRSQGFEAELLPKTGKYYMVSLGSFATRREAIVALEKLRSRLDQDIWVIKQ